MKTVQLADNRKAMRMYVAAARPAQKTRHFDCLMQVTNAVPGKAVQFKVAASSGSRVCIAGTFNNWDPTTHPLTYHPEDGYFKATLYLPLGTHQYKFVVNGVWQLDARCPHWALNTHGTLNSVVKV